MCYSAESSLTSFVIGMFGSILLLNSKNKTNKHIGLFLFSVVLIQFAEFLMWIDQDCGLLNSLASKSILFILSFQVYTIFLGAYLFKTTIINDEILKIILIPLTIIFLYLSVKSYFINDKKWCSKPNQDGSLKWANNENVSPILTYTYYFLFLIGPLLLKERWKGLLLLILGLLSFYYTRYNDTYTSNSRWCYYSAFIPILFVILDYYKF